MNQADIQRKKTWFSDKSLEKMYLNLKKKKNSDQFWQSLNLFWTCFYFVNLMFNFPKYTVFEYMLQQELLPQTFYIWTDSDLDSVDSNKSLVQHPHKFLLIWLMI